MEAMKKHLLNEADNCRHAAKMLRLDAETRRAVAQASAESATEYETKANEFERLAGLYPAMALDFHDSKPSAFVPDSMNAQHVGGYAYGAPRDDGSLSESM